MLLIFISYSYIPDEYNILVIIQVQGEAEDVGDN